MFLSGALGAAASTPAHGTTWATGPALQKRLAGNVDIVWSGNPLRPAIEEIAKLHTVAVLIDRRIDPSSRIDLTIEMTPLAEAFEKLAAHQNLSFGMVGPVAYFGPPGAAGRLRTLSAIHAEELRTASEAMRRRLLQAKPMVWKDFATPRGLLQDLAKQNGLKLEGLEQVPHDLWAAAELPAMPLLDRLLLVTMQLDLDVQIQDQGETIRFVAAAEKPMIVRRYDPGRDAKATAEKFAALAPHAEIEQVGDKIQVRGSIEDHQRLSVPRQAPKRPAKTAKGGALQTKIEKFTVQKKPLGPVLEQLASKLHLELQMDKEAIAAAGISLEQLISIDVKGVTIDELFEQLLKPTSLNFERDGDTIVISPK